MDLDFEQAALPPASSNSSSPENELFFSPEITDKSASGDADFIFEKSSDKSAGNTIYINQRRDDIAVVVAPVSRPWEYEVYDVPYGGLAVDMILEEDDDDDKEISYLVRFEDGSEDMVPYDILMDLDGGNDAITRMQNHGLPQSGSDSDSGAPAPRRRPTRRTATAQQNTISYLIDSSDDGLVMSQPQRRTRKLGKTRTSVNGRSSLRKIGRPRRRSGSSEETSDSEDSRPKRKKQKTQQVASRSSRVAAQKPVNYNVAATYEELSDESTASEGPRRGRPRKQMSFTSRTESQDLNSRRSGRNVQFAKSLKELDEDDIPERGVAQNFQKFTGAKEHFKHLPSDDVFRKFHCQTCDVCFEENDDGERGQLIFCQGCSLSYHQRCLGHRGSRDHLVTKIDDRDFVLQCRRCVNLAKDRDRLAPDQSKCHSCKTLGLACQPFRERKTVKQEQREREANGGEDPIVEVDEDLINKANNVLFRCLSCYRACHFHHLGPTNETSTIDTSGNDRERVARQRLKEYSIEWRCQQCTQAPAEVDGLVAWRPINVRAYKEGTTTDMMSEDEKEYLIKWKQMPHTKINWMPGPWVWGVTSPAMRKAFARRDNEANLPKMTTEDAIPEEYMRVDIIFDIEYTNVVSLSTLDVDLKRIKEVNRALVKFKGLGYEDTVWIEMPHPDETERYKDFKDAYHDWVMGKHIALPNAKNLYSHLSRIRTKNFENSFALREQPKTLVGGELMSYQLEGINWLYYQWFRQQNAILADEMGLGKTIQVIGFLSHLREEHGCWPFLVVVPNSTCPNWRREIKRWAPSLRVVTYYGSAEARRLAAKHELFPNGPKDLRCHVVVTSYDAAQDIEFRNVFRGVRWAGLIVDEGQRLKNDKSILYASLNAMKPPFKVLMTGTPLQNNARELFNLLQFLDPSHNAEAMDEQYAELDTEKVKELHEKLKPMFLRRTKAQVLTFLPAMAQIIVPVSLSTLQKKLYRSILAKNPELIRSIIGASKKTLKMNERANLNNILMQLRKCLCHPFVYSKQIEERSRDPIISHQNLVGASSKLQLLEVMLPMLQDRGHRVLIFSQFLDMLDIVEDFLDGLGLLHARLDGSVSSLVKQRRIDEFNAPNSSLFAFLLSTRAGGVGINLATADTVIILDPDFNPHQDIQALSRAHRIGQKKKVLVFQLTTRSTAEEKIMQIGKKKMMLDHVLIEQMDHDDDAGLDLESILRYGTEAIFADDDETQEIKYDHNSIDKLLDRSQVENTKSDQDKSAESQFSFAKVWVNEKGALEDGMGELEQGEPDPNLWDKILQQREREAQEEAERAKQEFGRGRRRRENVDYAGEANDDLPADASPAVKQAKKKRGPGSESDTDFQDNDSESEEDLPDEGANADAAQELGDKQSRQSRGKILDGERNFKRAEMPLLTPRDAMPANGRARSDSVGSDDGQYYACIACNERHNTGYCPLKLAGVEYCNLCGLPHFGIARTCPHLNSVTQLRAMVEALKQSDEPQELKEAAKKRVVGIIGDLNQRRRKKKEAEAAQNGPLRTGPHMTNDFGAPVVQQGPIRTWDSQGRPLAPYQGYQPPDGQENQAAMVK